MPRNGDHLAGKAITASAVSQRINRHLHKHGLTSTAHQLRHMAATVAYEGGRDIVAVQRLLGHASVDTTTIYTAIDDQAVRRAVESMPTLAELAARERDQLPTSQSVRATGTELVRGRDGASHPRLGGR